MVQRVFIKMDDKDDPVAEPHDISIWRDDQYVGWKLLLPDGWGWSPGGKGIVMSKAWIEAGGSEATPAGAPPVSGPDRRLYNAVGPGPAASLQKFSYEFNVQPPDKGGGPLAVDPDISNQPQP